MVLLDQNGVPQREAVVAAATAAHGVFLRNAQPGQRLAGVDNLRPGAGNRVGVDAGLAGNCRQQLQEIQRTALGGKQGAGIGADPAKHLVGCDAVAIGGAPVDLGDRVETLDAALEPGATAEHAGLARNDRGPCHLLTGNQAGGQVAGPDILGEGGSYVAGDLGGKELIEFDGHEGG